MNDAAVHLQRLHDETRETYSLNCLTVANELRALLIAQGADLRQPRTLDALLGTLAQHTPTFVRAVRDH